MHVVLEAVVGQRAKGEDWWVVVAGTRGGTNGKDRCHSVRREKSNQMAPGAAVKMKSGRWRALKTKLLN